jgi:two-component system response regulator NreC
MGKIKILIADDHQLFRAGLKSLLQNATDVEVVAEANNGQEVLDLAENTAFQVVLMDIDMPVLNGIDATRIMADKYPKIHVIVLSMYNQLAFINNLFSVGAKGYLIKSTDFNNLHTAITTVLKGEKYLDQSLTQFTLDDIETSSLGNLTPKEVMIIKYISEGLLSKQIADKLSVSSRTIDNYKAQIMRKLKVANNAELITYCIQQGILQK